MRIQLSRRLAVLGAVLALAGAAQVATAAPANAQPVSVQAIPTVFDLNGTYNVGGTARPVISNVNDILTVNMSAFGRPAANGVVINSDTIVVTFPDDATYGAKLLWPGTIQWSNGSVWVKLVPVTVPSVVGLDRTTARQRLVTAGFAVSSLPGTRDLTCERINRVYSQSPSAGTLALPGSLVSIRYYQPPLGGCDILG